MADNTALNSGTGGDVLATDEATYSGDTAKVQLTRLVHVSGAEGAKTISEIVGTAGSPGTAVVTVQGVGSGTVVPVSDGGGNLSIDDGGNTITVDGTVAVTGVATEAKQDTQITALQLLDDVVRSEDEASATGHAGAVVLAKRSDTPAATSGTDGDYEPLQVTGGRLATSSTVDAALPAGTNNIGDVDVLSIAAGDNNIGNVDIVSGTITTVSTVTALGAGTTGPMKAEDAAHATTDQGFPAWGVRQDSPNATAAASGDYHYLATDMVGGIRTALYETDFAVLGTKHVKKYYTSAGAATDGIIWSPAAGTRWYVTDIFINISAAATITLEDDLAGGDSAVWKAELAANSGWSHSFHTPLFSGEDAADLLITTTAGNVYVTVTGYEI